MHTDITDMSAYIHGGTNKSEPNNSNVVPIEIVFSFLTMMQRKDSDGNMMHMVWSLAITVLLVELRATTTTTTRIGKKQYHWEIRKPSYVFVHPSIHPILNIGHF